MREEVLNWWKQAKKDLRAAKNSLRSGDYEWASFQAHQAVEKALKSLFLRKRRTLPLTHDLITIGKKLGMGKELMKSLKHLNPEYVVSRYPNAANAVPYELYDEERAKENVRHAEKVIKWIERCLNL
jgi:HEPN domain-containing protein